MKPMLFLALAPLVLAQSVVVGTRTPDGKISFESVEDFQINGSRKIRLLPEQTDDIDPNVVRRLSKIDMAQAGLIRSERRGVEMHSTSRCQELDERFPGLIPAIVNAHRIQLESR